MGLLESKLQEEFEKFIDVFYAIALIAWKTKDSQAIVAQYLINHKFDVGIGTYSENDTYQICFIDGFFDGIFKTTHGILESVIKVETEQSLGDFHNLLVADFQKCYWLKSDFFDFHVIKELGLTENDLSKFDEYQTAKFFQKRFNEQKKVEERVEQEKQFNEQKAKAKKISEKFFKEKIELEVKNNMALPKQIEILAKNDFFTVFDAACLISLDEPDIYHDINYNDDFRYGEHKQAVKVIENGIKAKKLEIDFEGEIPKDSLQQFMLELGYIVAGFNDNLSQQNQSTFGTPTIQQAEPNIENLNNEITRLRGVVMDKTNNIEKLQERIAELEAEKMQFHSSKNAINNDEINIINNDLIFVAALVKMLSNEKRAYTQSKILEMIEDSNNGITGLSKSRTEKVMAAANKLYKPLIRNKNK